MGFKDLIRRVLDRREVTSDNKKERLKLKGGFTGYVWSLYFPRAGTNLTSTTLRQVYEKSSLVRYCVESIVNQIISFDIDVEASTGATEERAREIIEGYNVAGESFKDTLGQFLRDLLVLDAGVMIKVFSVDGVLRQLVVRDAATFIPVRDERGVLKGYRQQVTVNGKTSITDFKPDEVLYLRLFPKTYGTYGTPLIESMVNEVTALLYAGKSFADALSDNAAKDGILHLGSISEEAYQRAYQSFETAKEKRAIRVVDNVDRVEWISIGRSPAELQVTEQVRMVERIVLRVFGFLDPEVGLAPQYKNTSSPIIDTPSILIPFILNRLEEILNLQVFNPIGVNIRFKAHLPFSAGDLGLLVKSGVITPNEARDMLKLPPQAGGDNLQIMSPLGLVGPGGMPLNQSPEGSGAPPQGQQPQILAASTDTSEDFFFEKLLTGSTLPQTESH